MATGAANNEDLKVTKLFDVSNFVAVVTGGGTGIGLMCTQALVTNGAKVYITGRREDSLQTVVEKYNTGPGKIIAYVVGSLSQQRRIHRPWLTIPLYLRIACRATSPAKMISNVWRTRSDRRSRREFTCW